MFYLFSLKKKIPSCVSFYKYLKAIFSDGGGGGALFWFQLDAGGQDGVAWRRGEERRGIVWRSKGRGGGMCDDTRCEVFPHSVITCVKDSVREIERERERATDVVLSVREVKQA